MTKFEQMCEIYGLQDVADTVREEFSSFYFPMVFGIVTDIYIRLIADEDNEYFSINGDFTSKTEITESKAEEIADSISDKFYELLLTTHDENIINFVRGFHNGTLIYLNTKQIY